MNHIPAVIVLWALAAQCNADHILLRALDTRRASPEQAIVFSGTPAQKVATSYELHRRGAVSIAELKAYWRRVYASIDSADGYAQLMAGLQALNDANVCQLGRHADSKEQNLASICNWYR